MVEGVLGARERCRHVEVAVHHHDVQKRIPRHGGPEVVDEVEVATFFILPGADVGGRGVRKLALPLEFVLRVVEEERGVRTLERGVRWIEFLVLARGVAIEAGVAPVEAAHHQAPVAQQFLAESARAHAKVRFFHEGCGEAGEPGGLCRQVLALGCGEAAALDQRGHVLAPHEPARFIQDLLEVLTLKLGAEALVVPGVRGVRGQEARVVEFVPGRLGKRREVDDRGDEDDAVQFDAVTSLEVGADAGGAHGSIGLAHKVLGRGEAIELHEVLADEVGEGFDVLTDAVEVLAVLALNHARPAGGHSVDDDHVGHVEDRVFVVNEFIGRGGLEAVIAHLHALRSEEAHVDEDRRGTGAAVVGEGDGTRAGGHAVFRVRDEEDVRARLAGGALQHHRARGGGVGDGLTAELSGVLGLLVVVDRGGRRSGVRVARGSLGHGCRGRPLTGERSPAGLGLGGYAEGNEEEGKGKARFTHGSKIPQEGGGEKLAQRLQGRRGRCFAEMDLMIIRLRPFGSIDFDAWAIARSINSRTPGSSIDSGSERRMRRTTLPLP